MKVLNLSHNSLKSIPKGIERLQSLQTFDLQGMNSKLNKILFDFRSCSLKNTNHAGVI
jgi:Leucine-rich repeat (LRR) protein